MIKEIDVNYNLQIPLTLCLFGGYRRDDFNSVLGLHAGDLVICLNKLCGENITFKPTIKPKSNLRSG